MSIPLLPVSRPPQAHTTEQAVLSENTDHDIETGAPSPRDISENAIRNDGQTEPTQQDPQPDASDPAHQPPPSPERRVVWKLYTSHFLSTWNNRWFEFGSVLFLAAIFPDTLQPLSIYALVRSGAAIVFAPLVGRAIDRGSRLPVVRFSIIAGRLSVVLSCLGFWGMYTYHLLSSKARGAIFAMLVLLSCVEKPVSVLNLVAVERDWVSMLMSSSG